MANSRARKTARWLVAILLLTGGLTACGDGTTDAPPPAEAASATAQATPAPTAAASATAANGSGAVAAANLTYAIVDTGQLLFYGTEDAVTVPVPGDRLYGQDVAHNGFQPSYADNGDGTVTDLVTGLMWQRGLGDKLTFMQAAAGAARSGLAGYDDWRLPTLKELYSLILFSGTDPSGCENSGPPPSGPPPTGSCDAVPFIDTDYFAFEYGDESEGGRMIDSQFISATRYVGTTMRADETVFGVNFADGRIKGYPIDWMTFYVRYVRGNPKYGINDFADNGDGTITDRATALIWTQADSGAGLNWEDAVGYCGTLDTAGNGGWRLPNVKELQSIVDYMRSPGTTGSAAADPIFEVSSIIDEAGGVNYPAYWSSTTHVNLVNGRNAAYVAFGEALGWMPDPSGQYTLIDVHGAGAQRSDPKLGDPADWPNGLGPQGDVIRIFNYVRCVDDA